MKAAAGEEEIANKRVEVARSPSAATATLSTPMCTLRKYRLYYYSPTVQLPELCLQQAQYLWCICCGDSLSYTVTVHDTLA